jgi:hypothetical protein
MDVDGRLNFANSVNSSDYKHLRTCILYGNMKGFIYKNWNIACCFVWM